MIPSFMTSRDTCYAALWRVTALAGSWVTLSQYWGPHSEDVTWKLSQGQTNTNTSSIHIVWALSEREGIQQHLWNEKYVDLFLEQRILLPDLSPVIVSVVDIASVVTGCWGRKCDTDNKCYISVTLRQRETTWRTLIAAMMICSPSTSGMFPCFFFESIKKP